MRLRRAHVIAAGLALGLAGWLLSGQLDGVGQAVETAAAPERAPEQRERASVRVREVTARPIERVIVLNGKTEPARMVELRAETEGRVIALGPERGQPVAADEVILTLDPREREAVVAQARARLRQREIEYKAARELGAKGFQAETQVAEARAALEAARATLERAELDLHHTQIRAPFEGILEHRPVEVGDFVSVGDPVAMIVEQDPFVVTADVSERDVGRLATGMPARARLVTGRTVEGRLRYVASMADPATRTFEVELEVPNPDGRFAAGVSAELLIPYERVPAHRVPASALVLNDAGELGIKAVDDDGLVMFHEADIVRGEADAVWLAGLPERLRLIIVGQGFVRAGDEVVAVPESEAPSPGPLVAEQKA